MAYTSNFGNSMGMEFDKRKTKNQNKFNSKKNMLDKQTNKNKQNTST